MDGQEFPLSDPVVINSDGTDRIAVRLTVSDNDIAQMYRIRKFIIYRAFNGISEDELSPSTSYKLIKEVDI